MTNKPIHEKIKLARMIVGLTQSELAAKIGKTSAWLCGVEKGRTNLTTGRLEEIAQALDATSAVFYDEKLFASKFLGSEQAASSA